MWKWKGGMCLGLYRLFLSCLLFQSAIKREAPFIVTVNKTIRGTSSRVLGKISFQGSAYQRSWKVWKDCEGPRQDATFPHLHPTTAPCLSPKPHYSSKSHALHRCQKINKSITFPHTRMHSITTWLQITRSILICGCSLWCKHGKQQDPKPEHSFNTIILGLCFLCVQQVCEPYSVACSFLLKPFKLFWSV